MLTAVPPKVKLAERWCDMGFSQVIKQVAQKAKESGAFKPVDNAPADNSATESAVRGVVQKVADTIKNAPAGSNSSSGFIRVSDIAKVAEAVPSVKSATPDVGGLYKRLTKTDIEEEKKNKMGMKKGGKVSSASARADGIAIRGKTRA